MKTSITLLLLSLLVASCQPYKQDGFVEQYVVESFQLADNPLAVVRISKTIPFQQQLNFEDVAISNAQVTVHLLTQNGSVEASYPYFEQFAGIYSANDTTIRVLPGRAYRMEAILTEHENHLIKAETFVPGAFSILSDRVGPDTLVYQGPRQIQFNLTPSFYPGRRAYVIVNTIALDTLNFGLTPLRRNQFENSDNARLADFVVTSSNILTDANFDVLENGNLRVVYPWIGIAFYGPNELRVNFIDTNIYDFYRTQQAQFGGSTLSPGEINNVKSNIQGAIGLFGSYTQQRTEVFIRRNPIFN